MKIIEIFTETQYLYLQYLSKKYNKSIGDIYSSLHCVALDILKNSPTYKELDLKEYTRNTIKNKIYKTKEKGYNYFYIKEILDSKDIYRKFNKICWLIYKIELNQIQSPGTTNYDIRKNRAIHDKPYGYFDIIKQFFNYSCAYCEISESESLKKYNTSLTEDHVIPLSKQGYDTYYNIVCCCNICNSDKSNKDLKIWIKSRKDFDYCKVMDRLNSTRTKINEYIDSLDFTIKYGKMNNITERDLFILAREFRKNTLPNDVLIRYLQYCSLNGIEIT